MPDRLTDERLLELSKTWPIAAFLEDEIDCEKAVLELIALRKEVERLRDHVTGLCDWYDHNSANSYQVTAALDALRKLFEEQDQCLTD